MMDRRDFLGTTLAAGGALVVPSLLGCSDAAGPGQWIQRAIPSSGEMLPALGLGSAATFSSVARSEEVDSLKEVIRTLVEGGAKVIDTAPGYGASEQVAGDIAHELGITDQIFWATKVNVAGRGGAGADPVRARAQIESSFEKLQVSTIDAIQVHNLGDVPTQLGILKELKAEGRVRYIGVTSTSENRYPDLMEVMRNEPIDFIGVDYAVDNREAENEVLPLATERDIGVLVYAPFGRTRLWQRVGDREVPEWAGEFDAASWAQFFLKFVLSHPAVTVVTPATSQPHHMADNLGGGIGRVPDEAMRQRMIELVNELPPAPPRQRRNTK